jgi:hypothetical protein
MNATFTTSDETVSRSWLRLPDLSDGTSFTSLYYSLNRGTEIRQLGFSVTKLVLFRSKLIVVIKQFHFLPCIRMTGHSTMWRRVLELMHNVWKQARGEAETGPRGSCSMPMNTYAPPSSLVLQTKTISSTTGASVSCSSRVGDWNK